MHEPAYAYNVSRRPLFFLAALFLFLQALTGCAGYNPASATAAKPRLAGQAMEEGVPVNQWYMRTQDADGSRVVHYIAEYGTEAKPGNTVIVLHGGWGAEHAYLLPAIRPLADRYRFILYDQRGSLRTPVLPPAKVSFKALVEDLEQLRQRLGLDKVTLMAHSMGNHLAYGYLRAYPNRVAGLILVGAVVPARFGEAKPDFLSDVWPDFSEQDAALQAERSKAFDKDWRRRFAQIAVDEGLLPGDWAARHPWEDVGDLTRRYAWTDQQRTMGWRISFTVVNTFSGRNWRQKLGGMVFYEEDVASAVLNDPDYHEAINEFWPSLKAFRGPVRVIIGSHDYVDLGPTLWPKLVAGIADARLDVITNAGHEIWMDEPDRFTRSLRNVLAGIEHRP